MKIIKFLIKRLKKPLKLIKNLLSPGTIILLYHRVIDLKTDPQLLAVSPKNFKEQLIYLKSNYKIISLDCLISSIKKGMVPKKRVVITFDDGYVDNYLYAKPILEELKIPATIFVTTGKINKNEEFWWDSLERIFLLPKKLPQKLDIQINNKKYTWDLFTLDEIYETYNQIHKIISWSSPNEIDKVINKLFGWANINPNVRENYRTMKIKELKEIVKRNLIELGAHTMSHGRLSIQDEKTQKKEIQESKNILSQIIKRKIKYFSYPFGGKKDYNKITLNILKKLDFKSSCSNFPAIITKNTNIYELPRFIVRNWDLKIFKKKIKSFFLWY